jgi:hypothetical protein
VVLLEEVEEVVAELTGMRVGERIGALDVAGAQRLVRVLPTGPLGPTRFDLGIHPEALPGRKTKASATERATAIFTRFGLGAKADAYPSQLLEGLTALPQKGLHR